MQINGAKVVARYADGRLIKGYTFDFQPHRPRFHVFPDAGAVSTPTAVMVRELKALFFVRDHDGNAAYTERKRFLAGESSLWSGRVEVTFRDGEVLVGVADEPDPEASGLFVTPVDPRSNNLKVYAVRAATRGIRHLRTEMPVRATRLSGPDAWPPRLAMPRRLLRWLVADARAS